MAKYLLFHINKGLYDGKQVVAKEQMEYIRRGQTITSQDSSRITLYGHCWFVEQNNRYRVIFHTGTTWGFTALCAYVPEYDLGIMILVNSEAPAFPRYAIMRRMIDLYKGYPDKDYNTQFYDEWLASSKKSQLTSMKKAYVTIENGDLYIKIGPKGWKSKLSHNNGNEYAFRMGGNEFKVTFEIDKKTGKCTGFDINFGYTENFGAWTKLK